MERIGIMGDISFVLKTVMLITMLMLIHKNHIMRHLLGKLFSEIGSSSQKHTTCNAQVSTMNIKSTLTIYQSYYSSCYQDV